MTTANQTTSTIGSESSNTINGGSGSRTRERAQREREALVNAATGQSLMNYGSIFEGFEEKGIPMDEIKPRENVFTFNAWKALGRCVKKGEHGVKVCTFVQASKTDKDTGEASGFRMPRQTTVFHVTQTEELSK